MYIHYKFFTLTNTCVIFLKLFASVTSLLVFATYSIILYGP
nr:MAG TPA: hypothetical protein [Caudoviricetes sp.]